MENPVSGPRTRDETGTGASARPRRRPVAAGLAAALLIAACATPGSGPEVTATAGPPVPECLQPGLDTRASVVRIATDVGAHGSGVVIGHDRILTAAHVVYDAGAMRVALDDESYEPARLIAMDRGTDLALLDASTGSIAPVAITHHALKAYEDVWAIGFPLALDMAVSQGRFQRTANGKTYTSAWITAGVSGGGLMRCNHGAYELAGIMRDYVAFLRGDSYVNASQSTSTPAETILAFIDRAEPGTDPATLQPAAAQHSGTLTARPPSDVSL
jgi:Trypsin-like peptidase domain